MCFLGFVLFCFFHNAVIVLLVIRCLVGNKSDLSSNITDDIIQEMCYECGVDKPFKTSTKTGMLDECNRNTKQLRMVYSSKTENEKDRCFKSKQKASSL